MPCYRRNRLGCRMLISNELKQRNNEQQVYILSKLREKCSFICMEINYYLLTFVLMPSKMKTFVWNY